MLAALLIVFREVFEAGLIVGIVMAVTSGVPGRGLWIAGGVAAGVLGACLVALFTGGLSELFGGSGQEIFNASILGFAVLMLTWHNVWMARHGREMAAELRAAGEAVAAGSKSLAALGVVVAIAVLREGSEVVLFLYGVAAAQGGASFAMVIGGVIGLVLGSLVCLMTYLGLVTIPTRYLFGVTSALIALLGRRHGGAGDRLPRTGRYSHRARRDGVGYVVALERFKLSRPRAAHADRLCRSADRHAAHRLCGDARHDRRADEAVRAAARGRISRLPSDGSGVGRSAGEVIGTDFGGENLAEIGEFGFKAFDVETNDAAAGERQRDDSGRRISLGEFDGEQIEPRILVRRIETAALAGEHAFEAQRGPAAPVIRLGVRLGVDRRHPIEAVERHDEAMIVRGSQKISPTWTRAS